MNSVKRAMAVKLGASLTLTPESDGQFQLKAVNGPKTREKTIVIGQEVEEEGADGSSAKVT